jgi:ABC-type Zn2+ transport system substrate-binding protein/surface adhesin
MNKICTFILIIGQVLALSAWATAPVLIDAQSGFGHNDKTNHSAESVHMHLDQHKHSSADTNQDHEHDESCHLHLSIQCFSTPINTQNNIIKAIQNTYLPHHIGRVLIGPPTPPPSA